MPDLMIGHTFFEQLKAKLVVLNFISQIRNTI